MKVSKGKSEALFNHSIIHFPAKVRKGFAKDRKESPTP